jgi:uncharacterized membrane protein YphA (DoxX/SURF4 family)
VLQLTTQDGVALRWLSKGGRVAGIKCKRIIEFLFCTVVKGKSSMSLANTLGRGLLANMFIQNGFGAFLEPDSRAKKVEAAGLPQPRQSVILNGALMVLGGTMLAANIAPKLSAGVLAACLIPTTFVGHPYWKGVTVIFRAKHTLSRELASQADTSERLMMLERLRNDPHKPFFSIITTHAAIMEQ